MPNESGDGRQRGLRSALARLKQAGLVSDVRVFSYLWRIRAGSITVFADLCRAVREFNPDIILIQHPAGTGLSRSNWAQLRALSDFRLVFHEGDAYDLWRKRIPREVIAAAAASDVAFAVGASRQMAYLRKAGCRDVRWTPHVYNADDFGLSSPNRNKTYDVILIGNEISSKVPLKSIPGARERGRLVKKLSERFGERFAVFGRGWAGANARGPVPYLEQESVIQSAWVSANWDHYPNEHYYFSDRLPISLASGTIHVTSTHPGYDTLFDSEAEYLHHVESSTKVVDRVQSILERTTPSQRLQIAEKGREFAMEHLRQDDNLVVLLNAGGAEIDPKLARQAWQINVEPLGEM